MFSNLDPCFEEAVTRPCIPTWFRAKLWENKKTDLLAEAHCNRQQQDTVYYEPKHIQWVPCRFQHCIETIETQLRRRK